VNRCDVITVLTISVVGSSAEVCFKHAGGKKYQVKHYALCVASTGFLVKVLGFAASKVFESHKKKNPAVSSSAI